MPCNDYLNIFLRTSDLSQTGGRLPIYVPITQFFWNEDWQARWMASQNDQFFDASGLLTPSAAAILVANRLLPSTAVLTLRLWDVDSEPDCANGPPCYYRPEIDHVYVNGHLLATNASCAATTPTTVALTGTNGNWSIVSVDVPIEFLKFPRSPGARDVSAGTASPPTPAINLVEIAIGVGETDPCWGLACNWATLDTRILTQSTAAPLPTLAGRLPFLLRQRATPTTPTALLEATKVPPIILQHGWNASFDTWVDQPTFEEGHFARNLDDPTGAGKGWLDDRGLRYIYTVTGGTNGIYYEARNLRTYIDTYRTSYGTEQVAIIAHSKGGLDARCAMRTSSYNHKVAALVELDTPNMGSHWAGLASGFSTWGSDAVQHLRPRYLNRKFNYWRHTSGPWLWPKRCYHVRYDWSNYLSDSYWATEQLQWIDANTPAVTHLADEPPARYYRLYGAGDIMVSEEKALYPWQVRQWNQQEGSETVGQECVKPQAQWYNNNTSSAWEGNGYIVADHTDIYNKLNTFIYCIETLSPGFFGLYMNSNVAGNWQKGQWDDKRAASLQREAEPDIDYGLFHGADPDSTQATAKFFHQHLDTQPVEDTFAVARADTLAVVVLSEGEPDASLTIALRDPDGTSIDMGSLAGYPSAGFKKVLPGQAQDGVTLAYYRIVSPKAGTWAASVRSSSGRAVVTSAIVSSHYLFLTETSKDEYAPGDPIDVFARFQDIDRVGLTGAAVAATIRLSDGTQANVTLHDDGLTPDTGAADGIYAASFPGQTVPGKADIKIDGTWNDVVRVSFLDVDIVPDYAHVVPGPCIPASPTAAVGDWDGDGLYNTLNFSIPIQVNQRGHYELAASLYAGNALIETRVFSTVVPGGEQGSGEGPWDPGPHSANLSFNGRAIRESHHDGPFWIGNLELTYMLDGSSEVFTVDRKACACGSTPAYAGASFQRPRISIPGPNSDIGVDTDQDGRVERLAVTLGIDVTQAGTYRIDADLYDTCGSGHRITATGTDATLTAGLNVVTLDFDGSVVAGNGVDGPYSLRHVWVTLIPSSPSDSASAGFSNVHMTSAYQVSNFAGSVVAGTVVNYSGSAPVQGVSIFIRYSDPYYINCVLSRISPIPTTATGQWSLSGLAPGTYQIWAASATGAGLAPGLTMAHSAVSDTVTVVVPPDTTITLHFLGATGVESNELLPTRLSLSPLAPNPVHIPARIGFGLPHATVVSMAVFDIHGRLVRLLKNAFEAAGYGSLSWDGRSSNGVHVASGVYFVKLVGDGHAVTRRLVLLR